MQIKVKIPQRLKFYCVNLLFAEENMYNTSLVLIIKSRYKTPKIQAKYLQPLKMDIANVVSYPHDHNRQSIVHIFNRHPLNLN